MGVPSQCLHSACTVPESFSSPRAMIRSPQSCAHHPITAKLITHTTAEEPKLVETR